MRDIFISYVEEDNAITTQLAEGLEAAGYSTWYYERDGEPGASYLLQTRVAIDQCQAFILIISPHSVESEQITIEIVRAHEINKTFFPLRSGITHAEFAQRRPEWAQALGAATSVNIPPEGVVTLVPRLLRGIEKLGIKPRPQATGPLKLPTGPLKRIDPTTGKLKFQTQAEPKTQQARPASRTKYYLAVAAVLLAAIIGALLLFPRGKSDKSALPPLTTSPVREQFYNLQAWNHPPNWSVGAELLHVEESTQLGFLTGKNFRDFEMKFQVTLTDGAGAAWALRVSDKGYYLFYLSGPKGMHPNKFVTYLVRGDKMKEVWTRREIVPPLQEGGLYTISIKVVENNFSHYIHIDDVPTDKLLQEGFRHDLDTYTDDEDTFPRGSVGFRSFAGEKFAVADLLIHPPGTKSSQ